VTAFGRKIQGVCFEIELYPISLVRCLLIHPLSVSFSDHLLVALQLAAGLKAQVKGLKRTLGKKVGGVNHCVYTVVWRISVV